MTYQDVYRYQAFPGIIISYNLASNFIPTNLTFLSHFTHNHIMMSYIFHCSPDILLPEWKKSIFFSLPKIKGSDTF